MDIDDILDSVTRSHAAADPDFHVDAAAQQAHDLQALTHAWVAERVAPELLPYPEDLLARIGHSVRKQIEHIEDKTARMDAGTSFALVVLQTELERVKFMVRSFLRTRIAKIDAHPQHLLSSATLSASAPAPLSHTEHSYLTHHTALLGRHSAASFLGLFPPKLQGLDDRVAAGGGGSMVEGPDVDSAVFVRCLAEGGVEVGCGWTRTGREGDEAETAERTVGMRRGDVWVVRWRGVRDAVRAREVELI